MNICQEIHNIFNICERHRFPFDKAKIPQNGVYILFEAGEYAHGGDRIVRIGSHTGTNQLLARLEQHFLKENKDRSIFRKNIGRAMLNKNGDPFLEQWDLDLTTKRNRETYTSQIDFSKQRNIEKQVSDYIRKNFTFAVFGVDDELKRLELESKLISTVSLCDDCRPSKDWFGLYSPKKKIRESGLWLINHLYKTPLSTMDVDLIKGAV